MLISLQELSRQDWRVGIFQHQPHETQPLSCSRQSKVVFPKCRGLEQRKLKKGMRCLQLGCRRQSEVNPLCSSSGNAERSWIGTIPCIEASYCIFRCLCPDSQGWPGFPWMPSCAIPQSRSPWKTCPWRSWFASSAHRCTWKESIALRSEGCLRPPSWMVSEGTQDMSPRRCQSLFI